MTEPDPRWLKPAARAMLVAAAALVIAASGCYVGGDSPASEEGTAVAGEAGAVVSDDEGALPAASAAAPSDDEIAALDPPDAAASDDASDEAPDLVQRVVGAVSPLVGLLIDAFTGDETIEIGAFCNSRWDWAVDELRGPETLEDCRDSAEGGIRIGKGWAWEFWGAGFENTSPDPLVDGPRLIDTTRVVVSINDGPPIPFSDPTFTEAMNTLAPGRHTIRMNEWQEGDAWAGWTASHVFTVVAELEVAALCGVTLDPLLDEELTLDDLQGPETTAECRAAAAAGLHTGEGWWWRDSLYGVVDLRNVEYRFDGTTTVRREAGSDWSADSAAIRRLWADMVPGPHTVEVRELRPWGWTDWSEPYVFETVAVLEILTVCNARANREVGEWQLPSTAADCQAAAADGLRNGRGWDWRPYMHGIVDLANVTYRFNGGTAFRGGSAEDYAAFHALAPGRHTVEAREQRPWGWTDWSAPYEFETVAVVEVLAICSLAPGQAVAYAGCKAAERGGFDRSAGGWIVLADGVVEWDNVAYRLDGGRSASEAGIAADLGELTPGRHTVEIREQRPWGWTDWSPPYAFTVR